MPLSTGSKLRRFPLTEADLARGGTARDRATGDRATGDRGEPLISRSFDHPRHIVLVGMMGTGKSTVGRLIAERLGLTFRDSDAEIEAASGRTIPEIFSSDGEDAFRSQEALMIKDLLAESKPMVLALGGGAVLDPGTRKLLDGECVVWLSAQHEDLVERLGEGEGRPLLGDGVANALARLSSERDVHYSAVADAAIDTTGLSPNEVAAAIIDEIGAGL